MGLGIVPLAPIPLNMCCPPVQLHNLQVILLHATLPPKTITLNNTILFVIHTVYIIRDTVGRPMGSEALHEIPKVVI